MVHAIPEDCIALALSTSYVNLKYLLQRQNTTPARSGLAHLVQMTARRNQA